MFCYLQSVVWLWCEQRVIVADPLVLPDESTLVPQYDGAVGILDAGVVSWLQMGESWQCVVLCNHAFCDKRETARQGPHTLINPALHPHRKTARAYIECAPLEQ